MLERKVEWSNGTTGVEAILVGRCIFADKNKKLIVGAYVDDLFLMSSSDEMVMDFKRNLAKILDITDKEELSEVSGNTVEGKKEGWQFLKSYTLTICWKVSV